jgi:hypothetical protein
MDMEQMKDVLGIYEERLLNAAIPKERMEPSKTFESLSRAERLAHAHYLVENLWKMMREAPEKSDKIHRHFAAIQMCLGFSGWYTLKELMDHNR